MDLSDLNPFETLREIERVECETSFYAFLQRAWKYIDPSPFVPGWPLEAVCEHLEAVVDGDIRKLLINLPPRMGKSTICSVAFPAWVWIQREDGPVSGPTVPLLHASYAMSLAMRDSVKCRRLIESPWYQKLWGSRFQLVGDQNTKGRFQNTARGERLITAVDARVTGEGGNCFPAGAMVHTPSGRRAIETLRTGDAVIAFDHSRGKEVISKVVAVAERTAHALWEIHTISGCAIRCTSDHRLYSPGRGYICASALGAGDWLLREDGTPERITASMRYVRRADRQTVIRSTQGIETGQPRRLLFENVQPSTPRREACETVRSVQQANEASRVTLLLRRLQNFGARSAAQTARLFRVPRVFRRFHDILFAEMRGFGAFQAHAGRAQFAVQGTGALFEPVQGDGRDCASARQPSLRELCCARPFDRAPRAYKTVLPAGASRQREHAMQSARELDYALHEMSRETPQDRRSDHGTFADVGEEPIHVYDIQVEKFSNFFVEGILAHNCIIVDDPNAANEALSEALIETTNEWWDGTMSTRLNDARTGAYIVIQQRLGEEDLTGHILDTDDGWTHLMLPMEYEPERAFVTSIGWEDPRTEAGELLWEERFAAEQVEVLKKRLGPWKAAGQLQQRPEPKGGGIIKRDWWQLHDAPYFPQFDYVVASLDTAFTTKQENDFSALTVWGIFTSDTVAQPSKQVIRGERLTNVDPREYGNQAPKVMLVNAWQERLELHDLVLRVQKTCKEMKVDRLLIEDKAAGHSVAQELRRLFGYDGFAVQLVNPGALDKVARVYAVQHLFAEGMVFAPDRQWAEMVIGQTSTFPRGKHDDLVDTVSQALTHLRQASMLTRSSEHIAEVGESLRHRGAPPQSLYGI